MTKTAARTKLDNLGYKIVTCMSGGYIATKGQRTYTSSTLNGLVKIIC